jgi:hypothetical protein
MAKDMAFESLIKFRCTRELAARFERLAKAKRRDPSDMGRVAMEDYIAAAEAEEKLPPITPKEIDEILGLDPRSANMTAPERGKEKKPSVAGRLLKKGKQAL